MKCNFRKAEECEAFQVVDNFLKNRKEKKVYQFHKVSLLSNPVVGITVPQSELLYLLLRSLTVLLT